MSRKLLCVYCSSSSSLDPKYYALGEAVGRGLVERGWGLIYGVGNRGLMGSVARSVHLAGGTVVGVIPNFMKAREWAYTTADELVTVETMRERKGIMAERAAAFMALPGGVGTLEELAEIVALRSLDVISKPLVLLNHDGFYDHLLNFIAHMSREHFVALPHERLFAVAPTLDAAWLREALDAVLDGHAPERAETRPVGCSIKWR